ncbi:MAG TPA: VOC family protein [Thermoanaerobaculia bacterium]|nr:VOC family protein [Thermoanaerobaculia bacterium]
MSAEQPVLGKFVWHDLMTSDVDKAIAYYTELFGWTIKDIPMGPTTYKMIHGGGQDQGGIAPLDPNQGAPSHWLCHATVASADAAAATAEQLGGKVLVPPSDIPNIGRFSILQGPLGAVISAYTPNAWAGEGAEGPPAVGSFCWHELLALDPQVGGHFFSTIFGWTITDVDMGPMGTYHLFKRDNGKDAGGMLKKPDGNPPSAWLPYVQVADANATAERVRELGGQVFVPPTDIPNVGRFAVTADPTGAVIAILGPSS